MLFSVCGANAFGDSVLERDRNIYYINDSGKEIQLTKDSRNESPRLHPSGEWCILFVVIWDISGMINIIPSLESKCQSMAS